MEVYGLRVLFWLVGKGAWGGFSVGAGGEKVSNSRPFASANDTMNDFFSVLLVLFYIYFCYNYRQYKIIQHNDGKPGCWLSSVVRSSSQVGFFFLFLPWNKQTNSFSQIHMPFYVLHSGFGYLFSYFRLALLLNPVFFSRKNCAQDTR